VAALKAMLKPLCAEKAYRLQVFEDRESMMKGFDDLMMLQRAKLKSCLMQSSGILKYKTI
jgi:hypothetical protein